MSMPVVSSCTGCEVVPAAGELDLAAEHPALGVDLLDGELFGLHRPSGNSPRASMGFSKPRTGFSRDWEIYHDEGKEDERREKAGMLKHAGHIAVSFRRLFHGGLLPSRARFRFAG